MQDMLEEWQKQDNEITQAIAGLSGLLHPTLLLAAKNFKIPLGKATHNFSRKSKPVVNNNKWWCHFG